MNQLIPPAASTPQPGERYFCYGCGRQIHSSAVACPHCGAQQGAAGTVARQPATPMRGRDVFCRACGHAINAAAPLCPNCGAPQGLRNDTAGNKSRVAAALLALFLGGVGIHKFYLGQPVFGILYLLFCWTFIPAIVSFVEAIVYLCMSDESFARKYG